MFTLIVLIFTITLGFWLFQKKRNSSLKAFKIAPKKRLVLENWPKRSTVKSWRYRDLDPSWMNCFLIGLRSKRFRASLSRNLVVLLSLQPSGNNLLETLATQATFSYAVILAWNLVRIRLQNGTTLFSFIFAGLKFRENFLGTFRESLISRSWRKIVFAGNLISRNWRLSDFIFSFLQKFYVNQQLKQNQCAVPVEVICEVDDTPRNRVIMERYTALVTIHY